ncbi:hypothetical protein CKM354_000200100 [Cercospora kikuchii]|uniref:Uncharacterized protein n=1 Tax=Cercospora kikuchii TaxID=84275 RepID=A0A9P3C958_9PEZI|nr:uncharacterized protein CKM354_000200100 [Cercospora kikuchii]GIZ38588.1 hypothetical protein CKM354_000200100 [Cercospora kikuchii]
MFRQQIARNVRLFSTSVRVQKGPVEAAKDTLKEVDKNVSSTIVAGIEKGEQLTGRAKEQAAEGAKEAQRKAEDVKDQAARAAEDAKDKVKQ